MGHIAHLRKQWKSINTYYYIITLIKWRKNTLFTFLRFFTVLHLNKLESPLPKDALCQVGLKLAQWFRRRRFKISSMYFRYFEIISSWKRARPFILTNLNSLYPRMLCAKFGGNWLSGSGEEEENKKTLWHIRRRTNCDQKSSLELKQVTLGNMCEWNGSSEMTVINSTLKKSHCSKAMSAVYWSKFEANHR